jgi:hypothetical protein
MNLMDFITICKREIFPESLDRVLLALWYDARNDWDKAHSIVQEMPGKEAAWIHAYLHRKEGDEANASYWYHRAGKPKPRISFDEEWQIIVASHLEE